MYRREPDKETPVPMGGKVWSVPRLSKQEVREASRLLNSLAHDQAKQDEAMTDIYLKALRRNYPTVTRDEIEEMVTLSNHKALTHAVFGCWPC